LSEPEEVVPELELEPDPESLVAAAGFEEDSDRESVR
jgi:hypothetical protein